MKLLGALLLLTGFTPRPAMTRQLFNDRNPKEWDIPIQSEGAEVFYRNISIEPIKRIPKELLHMP